MNRQRPRSMQELEQLWYNRPNGQSDHYDCTRYHALNLHSVVADGEADLDICLDFFRVEGGVEQPEFNGALGEHTLEQKRAKPTRTHNSNEKYTFRTWLLRLGLNGEEFATARQHLLANLPGCIAWRDPAQAEAQKERMRQKREKELEERSQRQEPISPTGEPESAGEAEEPPAFMMRM